VKSECREGHTMSASLDSNCSTLRRVEKRVQMGGNVCEMRSNYRGYL
jgi:hypothetical protein